MKSVLIGNGRGSRALPATAQRTCTRRTVVEWLGAATVLALGSKLVLACSDGDGVTAPTAAGQGGAGGGHGMGGAGCDGDAAFPFAPGEDDGELYQRWYERTVDQQTLASILASWTLTVDGMVERPLELSFAELLELPRQDQLTDFHCVEGWSVLDVPWNGVRLSTLLDRAEPASTATHLTIHCVEGEYAESLPLDVAREPKTLLAYGVDCQTLPLRHGFPLRVVVPRKLGYKNAKYVERIELTDRAVPGFWSERGYGYDGDVPESRLRPGKY